jgi:hypothetical protein
VQGVNHLQKNTNAWVTWRGIKQRLVGSLSVSIPNSSISGEGFLGTGTPLVADLTDRAAADGCRTADRNLSRTREALSGACGDADDGAVESGDDCDSDVAID